MARETERTVNVSLRPMLASDTAWLDTWLDAVADRVGYGATKGKDLLARSANDKNLRSCVIAVDSTPRGVVVYRLHLPEKESALFELIATPPEHARKGAGMAAARLAEIEMQAEGIRNVYAPAAAANGISMYFWIRLGYAPLMREHWPCESDGIAWLKRSLID